jgi:hypothetical protein
MHSVAPLVFDDLDRLVFFSATKNKQTDHTPPSSLVVSIGLYWTIKTRHCSVTVPVVDINRRLDEE